MKATYQKPDLQMKILENQDPVCASNGDNNLEWD